MESVPRTPNASERWIPTLDGWRAVAILLVLLDHGGDPIIRTVLAAAGHTEPYFPREYEFLKMPFGFAGVHLFFALSGYLITSRLIEEERRRTHASLTDFYLRRLFRIQPAAILYLVIIFILSKFALISISRPAWFSAAFGYANLMTAYHTYYTGHFWTLAIEEQFYLLWPATFILLAARNRLVAAVAIALVAGIWRDIAIEYQLTNSWLRTDFEGEWLMWGCIAALVQQVGWGKRLVGTMSTPATRVVVLSLTALFIAYASINWKSPNGAVSLAAATTPLLFIATARYPSGLLGRVLSSRPTVWLGQISYSLYLWQQLFFVWDNFRSPAMGVLQSMPLRIVMALGCASISHYCLEKPMIELGRRIIRRLNTRARPVTSVQSPPIDAAASVINRSL